MAESKGTWMSYVTQIILSLISITREKLLQNMYLKNVFIPKSKLCYKLMHLCKLHVYSRESFLFSKINRDVYFLPLLKIEDKLKLK